MEESLKGVKMPSMRPVLYPYDNILIFQILLKSIRKKTIRNYNFDCKLGIATEKQPKILVKQLKEIFKNPNIIRSKVIF